MLHKAFLCCIFLFLTTGIAQAIPTNCQTEIRGKLHNRAHLPIVGVSIYIKELGLRAISDKEGAYKFERICAGDYTFVYEMLGYQSLVHTMHVGDKDVIQDSLAMEEGVVHLEETVVSAAKITDTKQETLTQTSLSAHDLKRQQGKSLGELLQQIAGVTTLQTGSNIQKPILHGLYGNRLLILNNGIRLESQQWGNDHAPEIDAQGTQRITVVKGAAAIRYGSEAMGGVILTENAPLPTAPVLRLSVANALMNNPAGGTFNTQIEMGSHKWQGVGFRFQTSAKYLGDTKSPAYTLSNTGTRELNFATAVGIKRTKGSIELTTNYFSTLLGVLRSAHIGNLSDLAQALQQKEPWYIEKPTFQINAPRQFVQHSLTKLQFIRHLSSNITLQARYGLQWNDRKEYDIRRGSFAGKPSLSLQLFTHTLETLVDYTLGENWANTTGMQGTLQNNHNSGGTGITPLLPNYLSTQAGIFTLHRYKKDRYTIEIGGRLDYKTLQIKRDTSVLGERRTLPTQLNFHNANFTVGFLYQLFEHTTLRTNFGTSWRPPHVIELFAQGLHHGVGSIEQGNRTSQPEKAWKWLATLERKGAKVSWEFTTYIHQFNNFLYLKPSKEGVRYTIRGAFPVFNYTQTQARFAGFDFNTTIRLGQFFSTQTQASAVWAKDISAAAKQLTPNAYLINTPPITCRQGIQYERSFRLLQNVYAQAQLQWTLRQNHTPRALTTTEINGLTDLTWQPAQNDNYDFLPAPAGYALLNIRIGGEYNTSKVFDSGNANTPHRWGLHLEVNNLLNTRYRSYLNRLRYYADEVGRNITLRLQYYFN